MRVKIPNQAWLWYSVALVIVALDLYSKSLASQHLIYAEPMELTSFFNFSLRHNYGAAFSFLSDAGGWQRWFFAVIAFVVSAGLIVWIARTVITNKRETFALSFILGGAVGNLYDRITLGHVVDFIELHYLEHYWPAFNLADSAITLGVIVLMADMLLTKEKKSHA